MLFQSQDTVELVMFEKVDLPVRKKIGDDWVNTGEREELTGYTFVDTFGNKFYAISKDSSWRNLKGRSCYINVDVSYNDYDRKNKVRLVGVAPAPESEGQTPR